MFIYIRAKNNNDYYQVIENHFRKYFNFHSSISFDIKKVQNFRSSVVK